MGKKEEKSYIPTHKIGAEKKHKRKQPKQCRNLFAVRLNIVLEQQKTINHDLMVTK